MKLINLSGRKFGRLTAIKDAGRDTRGRVLWSCECDCGKEAIVLAERLRNGDTKSCGCLHTERAYQINRTHGLYRDIAGGRSKLYLVWMEMKQRCINPNNKSYQNYGGRGIRICNEWMNYQAFHDWAMSIGYKEGLSIDRIDNDGDYKPSNCRWVSRYIQSRNTRKNRMLTFNGVMHPLVAWAEIIGIHPKTLSMRLKNGWPTEKLLSQSREVHNVA